MSTDRFAVYHFVPALCVYMRGETFNTIAEARAEWLRLTLAGADARVERI